MSATPTSPTGIPAQRLVSTHLTGPPFATPEATIGWHGAIQAQDYGAAKWALALRCGAADEDVDLRLNDSRVLRTHVLRHTWHLILPEDIRWLLALSAPRLLRSAAYAFRRAELDSALLVRSAAVIERALAGGNRLTRADIAGVLGREGIEATGFRLGCIVEFAELEAVICSGGLRGRQFTYALLDEVATPGPGWDPDAAAAELALRYLRSHGPALADDFAWWSGMTLTAARAAIALLGSRTESEIVDGQELWSVEQSTVAATSQPEALLLPNWDEFTVAYRDRRHHYDAARIGAYPTAATLLANTVVLDGLVVGTWRRQVTRDRVTVSTSLLASLSPGERAALERAAAAYGRFVGVPAELRPPSSR